jgi:hypothetical protein
LTAGEAFDEQITRKQLSFESPVAHSGHSALILVTQPQIVCRKRLFTEYAVVRSWSMISRDFPSGFSDIWRTSAGIIHTSHDLFIP